MDGTRIPAFWLPLSYGLPQGLQQPWRYALGKWEALGQHSSWLDRAALAGADVSEPEEALPALAKEFNQSSGAPIQLRFGAPPDFEVVVDSELGVEKTFYYALVLHSRDWRDA